MDYADVMERDMQKVWAAEDAAQKAAMEELESTMEQIWQEDTTLSEMTGIMRDDEVVMILDGVVEMLAHGGDVKKTLDDITHRSNRRQALFSPRRVRIFARVYSLMSPSPPQVGQAVHVLRGFKPAPRQSGHFVFIVSPTS